MRNIENEVLLKPAMQILDRLFIKYIHIQKSSFGKYDTNKKLKGFPDLCIFLYQRIIFIEFKINEKKKLSPDQLEWKNYIESKGHEYKIITKLEEFGELNLI